MFESTSAKILQNSNGMLMLHLEILLLRVLLEVLCHHVAAIWS